MFCRYCGNVLNDQAKFCNKCGQPVITTTSATDSPQTAPPAAAQQPVLQTAQQSNQKPVMPQPAPLYNHAPPYQSASGYPPVPPSRPAPRRKRRTGCLVLVIIVFLIVLVLGYIGVSTFLGRPKDLNIRYTQADFDSVMKKTGLNVDFMGMNTTQLTAFIKENEGKQLNIDDYSWTFSDFQEKKFELTQAEASAFINEIAPQFTWFDEAQVAVLSNGKAAGSYRVHFDKVKLELIADVVSQIPPAISALLPDTFNLYIVGTPFAITENEITMPAQLDELKVGPVSLRPIIGDTDAATRNMVMDYVERIYKQIPQLKIHTLKINANKNFEFSGYIPTKVKVTKK